MNNLEQITVSLEKAEELKEAGWEKTTQLYLARNIHATLGEYREWRILDHVPTNTDWEWFIAPTAEEILRELPCAIYMNLGIFHLEITTNEVIWCIGYRQDGEITKNIYKTQDLLVNAAASMWIYLKENNLLDTDDS